MRGRAAEPLEQLTKSADEPSPVFFFRGEGFSAEMVISQSGDFVVKAGSKARARTTPTIPKGTLALRETLLKSGVLRVDASTLVFASDYSFTSASAAAATVTPPQRCVMTFRRDSKEIQAAEACSAGPSPGNVSTVFSMYRCINSKLCPLP